MQEQNVKFGIITYWSLAGSNIDRLRDLMEPLGLESYIPEQTSPMVALREAMEAVYKSKLIRRTKKKGFVAVSEERGEHENSYLNEASVSIGEEENLIMGMGVSTDDSYLLREEYRKARSTLTSASAGSMLAKIATGPLGGTTLRPTGGIYWLPGDILDKWKDIATAIEACSVTRGAEKPSSVSVIRHRLDADSVKAVRDAIIHEVEQESAKIKKEMESGIGVRAMESKIRQSVAIHDKMKAYAEILNIGASKISENAEELEVATATAAFMEMA